MSVLVLNKLKLPDGYDTTIKGHQRADNRKEGEVNLVDLECQCNTIHNVRFIKMGV